MELKNILDRRCKQKMKNPQTLARQLQDIPTKERLSVIYNNACCAFVAMWALGIEVDDITAINYVSRMIDAGVLHKDCTVKWRNLASFFGIVADVEFMDITTIKGLKGRVPVRYDYNGKSHWVGVENGKIKFNPLENSVCVKNGNPTTARIIKVEK